jgi:hypothetical protein
VLLSFIEFSPPNPITNPHFHSLFPTKDFTINARWKWMLPVFQEKFEPNLPNPGIYLHFRATK